MNVSVAALFAAGAVVGALMAGGLMLVTMILAHRRGFPRAERKATWSERGKALTQTLPALMTPVVLLGGVLSGAFTPTEAAAVACVYAALVTWLVYRDLGWSEIVDCAATTVRLTAQIFIVVACAAAYSWLLTVNQIPQAIVAWVAALGLGPFEALAAINVLLLAVGCFVDPLSAIIVLTPLLVPLAQSLGIDGVHFGVVMMVNLAICLFTPPFGINIFVAQSVLKLPVATIYRGIWPFVVLYLLALVLVTYVPAVSLAGVRWFLF
jgi:C4-dicarboxylate transporter DctM subunit